MIDTALLIGFIVASAVIIFSVLFVKKSRKTKGLEQSLEEEKDLEIATNKTNLPQADRATLSKDERDPSIRPESNQQRNLDREVGGLEEGKKGLKENKEEQEKHIEDLWDKRSEEVDKMGSFNPLLGDSKESMIWRLKKIRLGIGKHVHVEDHGKEGTGTHYDSRSSLGGFSQMIKARQDFENENGGGMSR